MRNIENFNPMGMVKDLNPLASEYTNHVFDAMNIRFNVFNDNVLGGFQNEKGTKFAMDYLAKADNWDKSLVPVDDYGDWINGLPIGTAVIQGQLVVFTTGDEDTVTDINPDGDTDVPINPNDDHSDMTYSSESADRIYKFWMEDGNLHGKLLYKGELGFDPYHPIECVTYYENEAIQKVYWTDGLNQPRMINIQSEVSFETDGSFSFDFFKEINLDAVVDISWVNESGLFTAGTIQYALTYVSFYGSESNIFYSSPLYYCTELDRGGSPDPETCIGAFRITMKNLDSHFRNVRIYSIYRSSVNSTPVVKIVSEPTIIGGEITYTDTNTNGTIEDATRLLYVGGTELVFGTMSDKSNVLFAGDITIKRPVINSTIKEKIQKLSGNLTHEYEKRPLAEDMTSVYPYYFQLHDNSNEVKGFMKGEWYRLGLQFQYKDGSWSEVIYYRDLRIDFSTYMGDDSTWSNPVDVTNGNVYNKVYLKLDLDSDITETLIKSGYINARAVIVCPTESTRNVIASGVVNPTVYQRKLRRDNNPMVMSSWCFRPDNIFGKNLYAPESDTDADRAKYFYEANRKDSEKEYSHGYPLGTRSHLNYNSNRSSNGDFNGTLCGEWGHYISGPNFWSHGSEELITDYFYGFESRNVEIEGMLINGSIQTDQNTLSSDNERYDPYFFVDRSVVTLNSPDIEFVDSINITSAKFRLIGVIPITSTAVKIQVSASNLYSYSYDGQSFPTEGLKFPSTLYQLYDDTNFYGYANYPCWVDYAPNRRANKKGWFQMAYSIYPWQSSGSLCNGFDDTLNKDISLLTNKKYTEMLISSCYYSLSDPIYMQSLSPVLYDNTESNGIKYLGKRSVDSTRNILYEGNVSFNFNPAQVQALKYGSPFFNVGTNKHGNWADTPYVFYDNSDLENLFKYHISPLNVKFGSHQMPIDGANLSSTFVYNSWHGDGSTGHTVQPNTLHYLQISGGGSDGDISNPALYKTTDTVYNEWQIGSSMQRIVRSSNTLIDFKSTKHIVVTFDFTKDGNYYLPFLYTLEKNTGVATSYYDELPTFVNKIISPNKISNDIDKEAGSYGNNLFESSDMDPARKLNIVKYLWIGELYRENTPEDIFGGTTEEALEQNVWLVSGPTVKLGQPILWKEGDTYYQRYDCLKTYPSSYDDANKNQTSEILSYMAMTRVNIEGRYDRNRALFDNMLNWNTSNFNLMNKAYTQENNYFEYQTLNSGKVNLSRFPTRITWSTTKIPGSIDDAWTNMTMASTLDMDGDKGAVRALRRVNNELLCFQDKSVSRILFNENFQFSTENGNPVQIANSGKVNGYTPLSNIIGCKNKWSISVAMDKVFFLDSQTKATYFIDSTQPTQVQLASESLKMNKYFHSRTDLNSVWNPVDRLGGTSFYDKRFRDVFLSFTDTTLAYCESIGLYSSFYNYETALFFNNIEDNGIWISKSRDRTSNAAGKYKLWFDKQGNYNQFFDEYRPYSVTLLANDRNINDKVFDNLEYRGDSFDNDVLVPEDTFDKMTVWDEFQKGISDLKRTVNHISNLQRKFRIWRVVVPRDTENSDIRQKRNRIRNPWAYIKLEKHNVDATNSFKSVVRDLALSYFDYDLSEDMKRYKAKLAKAAKEDKA